MKAAFMSKILIMLLPLANSFSQHCLPRIRTLRLVTRSFSSVNHHDAKIGKYSTHNKMHSLKPIERKVFENLVGKCSVIPGSRLLLSVSGGSDSIAMLHIIMKIRDLMSPSLNVDVVHFDHRIRPESLEEAQFVKSLAEQYNIPFHSRRWDGKLLTTGMQENTRKWRQRESLDLLSAPSSFKNDKVSMLLDNNVICTAHHNEDQLETIILKLLRGVHISNIHGMLYRQGHFVKPMLSISKNELTDYLQENKFIWMEDSSNKETVYKRNRVRLELIPLLSELTGGSTALQRRIEEICFQSSELRKWIGAEALKISGKNIVGSNSSGFGPCGKEWYLMLSYSGQDGQVFKIQDAPRLVQEELIVKLLISGEVEIDYPSIHAILDLLNSGIYTKPRRMSLTAEWEIVCEDDRLTLRRWKEVNNVSSTLKTPEGSVEVLHPEHIHVDISAVINTSDVELHQSQIEESLKTSNEIRQQGKLLLFVPVNSTLVLRYRQNGDSFCPVGYNRAKSVSDFIRDKFKGASYAVKTRALVVELQREKGIMLNTSIVAVPPYTDMYYCGTLNKLPQNEDESRMNFNSSSLNKDDRIYVLVNWNISGKS